MSQFDQKNTCCKNVINGMIESAIKKQILLTVSRMDIGIDSFRKYRTFILL